MKQMFIVPSPFGLCIGQGGLCRNRAVEVLLWYREVDTSSSTQCIPDFTGDRIVVRNFFSIRYYDFESIPPLLSLQSITLIRSTCQGKLSGLIGRVKHFGCVFRSLEGRLRESNGRFVKGREAVQDWTQAVGRANRGAGILTTSIGGI